MGCVISKIKWNNWKLRNQQLIEKLLTNSGYRSSDPPDEFMLQTANPTVDNEYSLFLD